MVKYDNVKSFSNSDPFLEGLHIRNINDNMGLFLSLILLKIM